MLFGRSHGRFERVGSELAPSPIAFAPFEPPLELRPSLGSELSADGPLEPEPEPPPRWLGPSATGAWPTVVKLTGRYTFLPRVLATPN